MSHRYLHVIYVKDGELFWGVCGGMKKPRVLVKNRGFWRLGSASLGFDVLATCRCCR